MFESLRLSRGLVCVLKTFSAVRDYLLPAGDMIEVGAGGWRGLRTKNQEVNFLHFSSGGWGYTRVCRLLGSDTVNITNGQDLMGKTSIPPQRFKSLQKLHIHKKSKKNILEKNRCFRNLLILTLDSRTPGTEANRAEDWKHHSKGNGCSDLLRPRLGRRFFGRAGSAGSGLRFSRMIQTRSSDV